MRRVRLWDLPIRLFHWLLVSLITIAWVAAQVDLIGLHRIVGYAVTALLLFRLLWGLFGSETARFARFLPRPKAVLAAAAGFFQRKATLTAGHNPLGALAVVVMLTLIAIQVATGFLLQDPDFVNAGPWASLVSSDVNESADKIHKICVNVLLAMIGLHVATIAFYAVYKRESLLPAMWTGEREVPDDAAWPALRFAPLWRAAILAVVAGGLVVLAVLLPG